MFQEIKKKNFKHVIQNLEDCHVHVHRNKSIFSIWRNFTYTLLVFWRSVSEFPAGPAGDAKWVVVLGTVVVTSTDRKIYNYVFFACK